MFLETYIILIRSGMSSAENSAAQHATVEESRKLALNIKLPTFKPVNIKPVDLSTVAQINSLKTMKAGDLKNATKVTVPDPPKNAIKGTVPDLPKNAQALQNKTIAGIVGNELKNATKDIAKDLMLNKTIQIPPVIPKTNITNTFGKGVKEIKKPQPQGLLLRAGPKNLRGLAEREDQASPL